INRVVVAAGEAGAWARLERGGLTMQTFYSPFEADCRARGLTVDGRELMAKIAEASVPRPRMLEAIRRIRAGGLRVAALTNNWVAHTPRHGPRGARAAPAQPRSHPANPRGRPPRRRPHEQLGSQHAEARAGRGRDGALAPRPALRCLRRIRGGRPAQARSADLRAGLREARPGAVARRV